MGEVDEARAPSSGGNEPVDRRKIVYVIFVWLGVGTLLPWNFFITANAYWNHKFRTVPIETLTEVIIIIMGVHPL